MTPLHQEPTSQPYASSPRPSTTQAGQRPVSMGTVRDLFGAAVTSRLFVLSSVAALDGQIMAMAAAGQLSSPGAIVTVAFTLIAGVGSFLAALQEARLHRAWGRRVFALTALLSIAAHVAAAAVGVWLSQVATLHVLRYFAALALVAIAWEIGGGKQLTLPHGVPAPAVLMVAGLLVEVVL